MNILRQCFSGLKITVENSSQTPSPNKLALIQNAMDSVGPCPKEISQIILEYASYTPNRTKDKECASLINSIGNSQLSSRERKESIKKLQACVAQTQEVVIEEEVFACSSCLLRPLGDWQAVANAVNRLPIVASLTINASGSPTFYEVGIVNISKPMIYHSEQPQRQYRKGQHSVIQFLQELTLPNLEHFAIKTSLLYPQGRDDHEQDALFAVQVREGIQTFLFARASQLTSVTIDCERTSLLPPLQFPKTLQKLALINCTASKEDLKKWKQRYAQRKK
ncbi:MAG: hypothetical protein JWO53_1204 [Chlamydiia bacterium]|nr:hypothetical protein [Chlamydiia bacterium]